MSRRHVIRTILLALMGLLVATAGFAHSFGSQYPSTRYATRLDADGLWMVVVVEIPATDVLGDFRRFLRDNPDHSDEANVERFRRRQLEWIQDELILLLDGKPVRDPWRPVDSEINGQGTEGFFVYMVEHRAQPEGSKVELELDNQLLAAKVVFFSSHAEAGGDWQKTADNSVALLARGLEGEVIGPTVNDAESDIWVPDDALRTLRLIFERK